MDLLKATSIILVIMIIYLMYRINSQKEHFEVSHVCAKGDPTCFSSYGNIEMEIAPRASMGGGGLIKHPYRQMRGVSYMGL